MGLGKSQKITSENFRKLGYFGGQADIGELPSL